VKRHALDDLGAASEAMASVALLKSDLEFTEDAHGTVDVCVSDRSID
jgi:hypothetical protein